MKIGKNYIWSLTDIRQELSRLVRYYLFLLEYKNYGAYMVLMNLGTWLVLIGGWVVVYYVRNEYSVLEDVIRGGGNGYSFSIQVILHSVYISMLIHTYIGLKKNRRRWCYFLNRHV